MYAKMSFSAWISQLGSFRPTDEHGLVNRPQLPPSDCLIRSGKDGTESYRHHRLVASGHLTDQIVYTCPCVRCKCKVQAPPFRHHPTTAYWAKPEHVGRADANLRPNDRAYTNYLKSMIGKSDRVIFPRHFMNR